MRIVTLLISTLFILSTTLTNAQNVIRDNSVKKDVANVFYKSKYTLFDYYSDEPIFPTKNGIYNIYYASNEDKTPRSKTASAKELETFYFYKFKNYKNCSDWCSGKKYIKPVTSKKNTPSQKTESCYFCNGSGVLTKCIICQNKGIIKCTSCNGQRKNYDGSTCLHCRGSGIQTCYKCQGKRPPFICPHSSYELSSLSEFVLKSKTN